MGGAVEEWGRRCGVGRALPTANPFAASGPTCVKNGVNSLLTLPGGSLLPHGVGRAFAGCTSCRGGAACLRVKCTGWLLLQLKYFPEVALLSLFISRVGKCYCYFTVRETEAQTLSD